MYRVSNVSKYVCVCVFSSPWAIGVWSSKHWGFPMRDPQNGLFTMESPVKLDDLGKKMRLLISGTDIYITIHGAVFAGPKMGLSTTLLHMPKCGNTIEPTSIMASSKGISKNQYTLSRTSTVLQQTLKDPSRNDVFLVILIQHESRPEIT